MTSDATFPAQDRAAPTGDWRRFYVPEVHDLYPSVTPAPEAMFAVFPDAARGRIAHSVVPDWQGRDPIGADPDFSGKILAEGGTVVLHGLTHSLGPSFLDWLVYGHDNRSEFRTQSEAAAKARIETGIAAFRGSFGAAPRWFCAPRWQESAGTVAALKALGFTGILSRTAIRRFRAPDVPIRPLNFDEGERSLPIALAMRRRTKAIARILRGETPFRLVVHPHDLLHARTRAQLTGFIADLDRRGWQALSLDEALARWDAR